MTRPAPVLLAPPGYHHQPAPESSNRWRPLPPEPAKRCRYLGGTPRAQCPNTAVAETDRGRHSANQHGTYRGNWWAYCLEHLYGRWIENGRVMYWRLIADGGTP